MLPGRGSMAAVLQSAWINTFARSYKGSYATALGSEDSLSPEQHELTQARLAEQVGLAAQAHIAYIESGHDAASLDLVIRIANVFRVTTDYLLRDTLPLEAIAASDVELGGASEELPSLFGTKLHILRTQHNLSQADLARQLGLASRAYISNLEAGRKAPSLDLMIQLADLFGSTTDYLLRDSIPVESTSLQF